MFLVLSKSILRVCIMINSPIFWLLYFTFILSIASLCLPNKAHAASIRCYFPNNIYLKWDNIASLTDTGYKDTVFEFRQSNGTLTRVGINNCIYFEDKN